MKFAVRQSTVDTRNYRWCADKTEHELRFVRVPGTRGTPYCFGAEPKRRPITIRDFYIMHTPVTQALWKHVMGGNPADRDEPLCPVTHVSWNDVAGPNGFVERINASEILPAVAHGGETLRFRLPSETEWEYAARGGPHWKDGFRFSGSNEIDDVGWYGAKFSTARRLVCRIFGWRVGWRLAGRFHRRRQTRVHPVAAKAANQLGIYDMSGNVWEWCQDILVNDLNAIPTDGTPFEGEGTEHRLRAGCHQNWDLHCTVWWRYGIAADAADGCLGFRLVLAPLASSVGLQSREAK